MCAVQEPPSVFTTSTKVHRMQVQVAALTSQTLGRHSGLLVNGLLSNRSKPAPAYERFWPCGGSGGSWERLGRVPTIIWRNAASISSRENQRR
jgi:hypothetical protein